MPRPILLALALAVLPAVAVADTKCPPRVTAAAKKTFPKATLVTCARHGSGYEAKLEKPDTSMVELDISANGEIEQIEEIIPVSDVPAAVSKAFAAKYGKATMLRAEKQTRADKRVSFEVAFKVGKSLKEATFRSDGTFVEEE